MKATPEMIAAGAEAAREYMQETGGNSPAVIWDAMWAAQPAQCAPADDGVCEALDCPNHTAQQEPDDSDDLTIAYMAGVQRGKELAKRPTTEDSSAVEKTAQQEPVAIHQVFIDGGWKDKEESELWQYAPEIWQIRAVYTSPPPQRTWVDLTDEDMIDLQDRCGISIHQSDFQAIGAKLKEKNT